jgi:hypothetical protein
MCNRNKIQLRIFTVLFCIFGVTTAASAESIVPSKCEGSFLERAHYVGYLTGGNIVNQAWNAIENDCNQVVEDTFFTDVILNTLKNLGIPAGAPDYVFCRYHGYIAGAADQLSAIEDECIDQCVQNGNMIGELATMMYCELSIALGGLEEADDLLEGVLSLCGEATVDACETLFNNNTPGYENFLGQSCEPYTQDEFSNVWEQAKHNQCVYNPVEEDTDTADTDTDTDSEDVDGGVD